MSIVTQAHPDALDTEHAKRVAAYELFRSLEDDFEAPPLAGRDDVEAAAIMFRRYQTPTLGQEHLEITADHHAYLTQHDGATFRVMFSPGAVGLSAHDAVRRENTFERNHRAGRTVSATISSLFLDEDNQTSLPDVRPTRVIRAWSPKSRARMFRTIPQLDLSTWDPQTGVLAMVTLTLPGDWEAVAPTGKHFKTLIDRFRLRWIRAGLSWVGLWKLEFQRRGAPHLHALMRIPVLVKGETFERWVAETWADVCQADNTRCHGCKTTHCACEDPDTERRRHRAAGTGVDLSGEKYTDPRRIATYFLGHSSKHTDGKEYQHVVPEPWQAEGAGPGRFWGYWGLDKGTIEIDVDKGDWHVVRRMLRKIAKARAWRQGQQAAKYGRTIVRRPLRSLGHRGRMVGGVVIVNDGVQLAYDLARAIQLHRHYQETERWNQ